MDWTGVFDSYLFVAACLGATVIGGSLRCSVVVGGRDITRQKLRLLYGP